MLPHSSLFIEDIAPRLLILAKVLIEYGTKVRSGNFTRRAYNMTLDVLGKPDRWQGRPQGKNNIVP
jgi:hypothetical protein